MVQAAASIAQIVTYFQGMTRYGKYDRHWSLFAYAAAPIGLCYLCFYLGVVAMRSQNLLKEAIRVEADADAAARKQPLPPPSPQPQQQPPPPYDAESNASLLPV